MPCIVLSGLLDYMLARLLENAQVLFLSPPLFFFLTVQLWLLHLLASCNFFIHVVPKPGLGNTLVVEMCISFFFLKCEAILA